MTNPLPNMTNAFWFATYSRIAFCFFFVALLLFATSVIAGVGAGTGESKTEGGGKGGDGAIFKREALFAKLHEV